jgi:PKD repeat protein
VNNDATTADHAHPAIAVAPDRSVLAVWDDPRNLARGRDIYFSKSTDLGNTWSANIIVNDDVGGTSQDAPDIAVNPAGTIFVAWSDSRNANTAPDIYATRSTNGGASFAANVKVNDDAGATYQGSVALAAGPTKVQAIWTDTRTWGSTGSDIYSSSTTDGITWAANQRVNDDNLPANYQNTPTVGVDASGDVFAAWFDQRSSGQDVYAGTLDVVAPQARAGADQTVGQGVGVAFNGSASSDNLGIASYSWDFGDGTRAATPGANHAYTTPGSYVAGLTVTDYSGNMNSASVHVAVQDTTSPVARGGGDRSVDQGQPLFFDAGASTDNVGVTSYLWDFGDGTTSSLAAVSHTYATPGNYTVTLTVKDAAGNKNTAPMQVTVRTVSPTAGALLGMVQTLQAALALMGVALVVVGILAFLGWRQRRPPTVMVDAPPPTPSDQPAPGVPPSGGGPR